MQTSPKKLNRKFTYKDYLSWTNENERWELIDGIAYDMSPAPTKVHQYLSSFFTSTFFEFLKDKDCDVYAAPFDIRLPGGFKTDNDVDTVVQPDISVFCDKTKLDDRGGNGAPDLIIEILSPSTASKDLKEKFFLYERVGVKEYWVVDPANRTLTVYILDESGKYARGVVYAGEDILKTALFDGLEISLEEVYRD
ncbi:MAG: Uma2 family endonuclease [Spirochaetia bacterium]|jgi:Uma2 family endonuclease|nr:Uma2 family endonuclease [Spirochaetia bacterium]